MKKLIKTGLASLGLIALLAGCNSTKIIGTFERVVIGSIE
jgi:hypothetical protein